MARSVEASEGLALIGVGSFGGVSTALPGLVLPDRLRAGYAGEALGLSNLEAIPGSRAFRLSDGTHDLELRYRVPTPEVSGTPGNLELLPGAVAMVHWPLDPGALAELSAARPQLLVLENARALLTERDQFTSALASLRRTVGGNCIIWAPRVASPHRLAFLAYVGVDLVDAVAPLLELPEGGPVPSLGVLPRGALVREGLLPGGETADETGRERELLQVLGAELALVRAAGRAGRLRELVEARLTAEPLLAEQLRYADRHLGQLLDERAPVLGDEIRTFVLSESLRRPEVARYRRRFLERYRPPPSKQVLLLVPCSRTKPYRDSRSHRRFARALEELPRLARLHVASLTSPLGAVPRELEDLPPARHYDIPVTGTWSAEEAAMVTSAVDHLRRTGSYRRVIAHLDPIEYGFLSESLTGAHWTLTDHASTSPAALDALRAAAAEALDQVEPLAHGPLGTVREELRELAAVQFGRPAADALFDGPVRLHGRPWAQRLTDPTGTDLATWQDTRGLFHLTVAGGQRLLGRGGMEVETGEGVELRGDLFTPGVSRADPQIRTGDAVLVVRAGALVGVGEAALPGPLMTELPRGLAVRVRHRSHTAAPPTST